MSLIERGENKTLDIFWRNSPWDSDTWTRFKCQESGENATLVFPRCLTCFIFKTTMEEKGLRIGGMISQTYIGN